MLASAALPLDRQDAADTSPDDLALLLHAAADPAAFEALYRRYRDRIYWYLQARTQGEEDAADLTQQVFLRALASMHLYHERKGSVAAWLFGIARHAAIDLHRRQRAMVALEDLPEALHPEDGQNIEAEALRREALARLRHLLADLSTDTRELLALRFAGGLTLAEIAVVIGKSVEATRKQLSRTLQKLEEQYRDAK